MRKFSLLAMALAVTVGLSMSVSAATGSTQPAAALDSMYYALLLLFGILAVLFLLCILVTLGQPFDPRHRKNSGTLGAAITLYASTLVVLCVCVCSFLIYRNAQDAPQQSLSHPTDPSTETHGNGSAEDPSGNPTEDETTIPTEDPRLSFAPVSSDTNSAETYGVEWQVIVNDEIVESYTREEPISFGDGADYFALPGVATFRGNNYRNNPAYGVADIEDGEMTAKWNNIIGRLNGRGGCAWTGQPLLVQWDEETKSIMNLYKSKKEKEDLVEIIYATLDGYIHFFDMDNGSETRDPIYIGLSFKGAGALDPRGYPLLYVGPGYYLGNKAPRMYIISLIDGSILYEYGNEDPFASRDWTAFDSSPLVDAETDTLIWPGESGMLYTIKLNTEYDKEAGTISVNPDTPVKTHYSSNYSESGRYLGYEASVSVVNGYLYVSENGGLFYCIDLNTMELVWVQDTKDDSNSTPVFEWGEDGEGYIYTAPSLHWNEVNHEGTISIYKLNAATGDIVWEYPIDCVRYDTISGGVQSTPLLGRDGTDLEGMVIYTIARTPTAYRGLLTAFDKETGEVIWETTTGNNYAWSSPVALYTEDGRAYIFFVNASGRAFLIDGATGEKLATMELGATTEASPVVFNNTIIIGTRERVYRIDVS